MGERVTDEDHRRSFDVLLEHMASDWSGQGPVSAPPPPQLGTLMVDVDVGVGVSGGVGVGQSTGFLTGTRRPDSQSGPTPAPPPPHNYNLFQQQQQVCALLQQHIHPTSQQLQQLHHFQQQQQLHIQLQLHQQQLQQQQLQQQQHQLQQQQLQQQQHLQQQQLQQLQQHRLQHPQQQIPQQQIPQQQIPQPPNPYPQQHHQPQQQHQQLQQQFQQHLQQQLHQQQQQKQQQHQQQQQRQQQNEPQSPLFSPNQDQLIQNLVGNWTVPNLTGTYNPFGLRQMQSPDIIQEPQQTEPQPEKSPTIKNTKRTRIVAEVRPMRPSYSSVLTNPSPSPSPQKPNSPGLTNNINNMNNLNAINTLKLESGRTKGGNNNSSSNTSFKSKKNNINAGSTGKLRRQHSSGSDEQSNNNPTPKSSQSNSAQSSRNNRKSGGEGNNGMDLKSNCNKLGSTLSRRWVSLDDLDSNGNSDSNVFESFDNDKQKVTGTSPNATRKKSKGTSRTSNQDESFLNNQKASSSGGSAKSLGGMGPGSAKRPIHINNLGTPHWSTTKELSKETPKEIPKTAKNCRASVDDKRGSYGSYKGDNKTSSSGCSAGNNAASSGVNNSSSNANRSSSRGSSDKNSGSQRARNQRGSKRKDRFSAFVALLRGNGKLALLAVYWFLHLLSDVLDMSLRLTLHMCAYVWESWVLTAAHWVNGLFQSGLRRLKGSKSQKSNRSGSASQEGRESVIPGGLTSNISMPSTGEEAMKRLLACKGKDPYSILGVTPTCSDDDVKKYYKRQAFLVHPDKNNQPGAEEAFKILVHAFELIGEPEKRADYDRCVAETQQVEQAWSELSELLSQLHQKMEYAANTIRCTNCGKRHKRVAVPRKPFAARFCAQCKIKHSAKEGDMWAETTVMGFLWRYYACMEGSVHDITDWAACQADNLRHLKPNSHSVQYRIVLGKQQRQHQHGRGPSEPDLENFLSSLYNQSGGMGTKATGASETDDMAAGAAGCSAAGGASANGGDPTCSAQGGRQRRKGKRNKF